MVLLYLGQAAPGRKKDPESRGGIGQSRVAVEPQKAKWLRGAPESPKSSMILYVCRPFYSRRGSEHLHCLS